MDKADEMTQKTARKTVAGLRPAPTENTLPPLPDGWEWVTMGEVTNLFGGGTPSRTNPAFFNGDIVWLTPT
ncbi:MAG: hypothetical protein ACE5EY_08000, partial [Anaerolineae bacterium]